MMAEFTAPTPAVPFGKIRRDRNSRSSHLGSQPVLLFVRPITRYAVDGRHEFHRFLPGNQILVSLLPNGERPAVPSFAAMSMITGLHGSFPFTP